MLGTGPHVLGALRLCLAVPNGPEPPGGCTCTRGLGVAHRGPRPEQDPAGRLLPVERLRLGPTPFLPALILPRGFGSVKSESPSRQGRIKSSLLPLFRWNPTPLAAANPRTWLTPQSRRPCHFAPASHAIIKFLQRPGKALVPRPLCSQACPSSPG